VDGSGNVYVLDWTDENRFAGKVVKLTPGGEEVSFLAEDQEKLVLASGLSKDTS
jgi:hypothetical protein